MAKAKPTPPSISLQRFSDVICAGVRRDTTDLTARQMAVLLQVYLSTEEFSVKHLAERLNVSKPAVTRSLDRLAQFDYTGREVDAADRRLVRIVRTKAGYLWIAAVEADLSSAALSVKG